MGTGDEAGAEDATGAARDGRRSGDAAGAGAPDRTPEPGAADDGARPDHREHPDPPAHPHAYPEPVDPDIDFDGTLPTVGLPAIVAVVALGGAIGAAARFGAGRLWPTAHGAFPWTTFAVNAVGCAVIGVFLVVVTELYQAHPLVRPFFGTGVLGGFTTFSTYAVDIERLVKADRPAIAVAYLAGTLVTALVCVGRGDRHPTVAARRTGAQSGVAA
ncbi:fluoride efflux transporter CrcB [Yinghuangia aomiensis]